MSSDNVVPFPLPAPPPPDDPRVYRIVGGKKLYHFPVSFCDFNLNVIVLAGGIWAPDEETARRFAARMSETLTLQPATTVNEYVE